MGLVVEHCAGRRFGFFPAGRLALLLLLAAAPVRSAPEAQAAEPQIFAPGVVSAGAHETAPAFTPDAQTVYFGRTSNDVSFILQSQRRRDGWSAPEIAPFSGEWLDMEPAMAPDGSYLVFVSNRPATEGGRPIDGRFGGVDRPGKGANLWCVNRTEAGWGEPIRLPDVINSHNAVYAPSIAADGTLYFMQPAQGTGRFQLFSAQQTASGYAAPVPLPFSDGSSTDVDPAVAPDKSFLIFGSGRSGSKSIDLYISFAVDGGWSEPQPLGDAINSPGSDAEPRLGPDLRTLYFSSERLRAAPNPIPRGRAAAELAAMTSWNNGQYNIWQVDLAPILQRLRPRPLSAPAAKS